MKDWGYADEREQQKIENETDCKFCIPERPCAIHDQVGGDHYKMPIEPLEFILANNLSYCEANVIKYVCRHERKNGAEDLQKAIHYLRLLLQDKYDIS